VFNLNCERHYASLLLDHEIAFHRTFHLMILSIVIQPSKGKRTPTILSRMSENSERNPNKPVIYRSWTYTGIDKARA